MNYKIAHIEKDFSVSELDNKLWKQAKEVSIKKYWSGKDAPKDRQFKAKILWSDTAVYVRFEANQNEPLIVSEKANLETKTRGLWDRDVCEIFLAPDKNEPRKYFEFEIAPNGEWIDLGIFQKPDERITDWDYAVGNEVSREDRKRQSRNGDQSRVESVRQNSESWRCLARKSLSL